MNRKWLSVLGLAALVAWVAAAVPEKARVQGPDLMTGTEDVIRGGAAPDLRPTPRSLDDWTPGSIVDTAGWTWYDIQTNGTHGKQIGVDAQGLVHMVFTTGTASGSAQRHIYYNVWDPTTQDFSLGEGSQVDASSRAGYCNVAVDPAGWAYPFFHQVTTGTHTAAAIDFLPGIGAFTTSQIPPLNNADIIWPHACVDAEGNLQSVSTNNPLSNFYYAKGHPMFDVSDPDSFGSNIDWTIGLTEMETQSFITADIAASFHTQKVAIAWLDDHGGSEFIQNDVYYKFSEDAGETWSAPINVTNFHIVDPNCCDNIGDPNACNGDTLQPWLDLAVFIDNDDVVHIAFTTSAWYYFDETCTAAPGGLVYSMMWHWDESHLEYNRIGEAWYIPADTNFTGAGVNNLMIQRPNLAQDTTSGYLYCSFQKFDSLQASQIAGCGGPVGDAYVSVSTDGGHSWAVPTNVTNTLATPTNDRSERDITIAPIVDDYVHMQYQVDHAAGSFSATTPECIETHNEIVYQRIPVEDIALTPLTPPYPLRSDSTGFPEKVRELPGPLPKKFALYANYPNPFNPTTNIQFDLAAPGTVSLKVFDVTGREVSVLLNNERVDAGAHVVEFNASSLPSGVYFYRLENRGHQLTRKMMLIK